MTRGERRYFCVLAVIGTLSLSTIGATVVVDQLVPRTGVLPFLATRSAIVPAQDAERSPEAPLELRLEAAPAGWPLAGEMPPPCVATLQRDDDPNRWLPPLDLDEEELGCLRFD